MRRHTSVRLLIAGVALLSTFVAAAPPASAAAVRPFGSLIEAESFSAQHGIRVLTDPAASGGHGVAFSGGDWIRFDDLDFGTYAGSSGFATWRSCATGAGGMIDLRLDSPTATPFLTFTISGGSCATWGQSTLRLGEATTPTGVHTLYLQARPGSPCEFYHFDSFQMIKQTSPPIP